MWAILDQSFPVLFWSFDFNKDHFLMQRKNREDGRPSSSKDRSLLQQLISNVLRSVRCWSPLYFRFLRFKSPLLRGDLRLLGSKFSFGNDTTFLHPPSISNRLRHASFCKPHSFPSMSLLHKVILSKLSFEGKPASESDTSSGQLFINIERRELSVCNWWGNSMRFLQLENQMDVSFGVGNPPFGKDTSLGQSLISKASRDVGLSWISSGVERDSRFVQSQIERVLRFGKKFSGRDIKKS